MLACLVLCYVLAVSHCYQLSPRGLQRHAFPVRFRTFGKSAFSRPACIGDGVTFPVAQELKKRLVTIDNSAATLRNLVQMGDEWSRSTSGAESSSEGGLYESQFEKVSGCASAVEIKTSLYGAATKGSNPSKHILVEGRADSRVTQGMVAALCQLFNTLSLEQALAIDAEKLTTYFGFDALMPVGRQNTFLNTIRLIQSQIKRLSDGTGTSPAANTLVEPLGDSCTLGTDQPKHLSGTQDIPDLHSAREADPRASEIAMLLSGGVDSSVALKLLLEQGHKVRAYYLKIWLEDELAHLNSCPWEEDLRYAQAVCDQLGVPLETVSLQREYWRDVVQYTLSEARAGRTPNPDIMCNSRVKFGTFYDFVGRYHKKIATGHYAQVMRRNDVSSNSQRIIHSTTPEVDGPKASEQQDGGYADEEVVLLRSPDPVKDQSYFLCNLRQEQLRRCVFPIGHLHKHEVRALAEKFNLPTKDRKDSQGICFLGKLKFDDFIEHYLGQNPGPVICVETCEEIGAHRGLWFHTIGQRKGLGPLLRPGVVHAGPWYVAGKDVRRNALYVSHAAHTPAEDGTEVDAVQQQYFTVGQVNWINGIPEGLLPRHGDDDTCDGQPPRLETQMKLRHSPRLVRGRIQLLKKDDTALSPVGATEYAQEPQVVTGAADTFTSTSSGPTNTEEGSVVRVEVLEEGVSIAPGQFAAFYDGEVCLGAGVVADLPPPVVAGAVVDLGAAAQTLQRVSN